MAGQLNICKTVGGQISIKAIKWASEKSHGCSLKRIHPCMSLSFLPVNGHPPLVCAKSKFFKNLGVTFGILGMKSGFCGESILCCSGSDMLTLDCLAIPKLAWLINATLLSCTTWPTT